MKKTEVKLSQCMIVKNEEDNIEQALSWGKDIVFEQIVVDTGSTDKTVKIAEKMGAKVFHFPWVDDFSAAKNFAIEQARGNWIALLDADEYFSAEDVEKLMGILQQAHYDERVDIIRTKWVHLQSDGNVMSISIQDRIFRNKPNIRYRYRIHEELYLKGNKKIACYYAPDDLWLLHSGYGKENDLAGKGERNAQLLKRDLEDDPKNGKRLMYLADAYNIADREQDAIECYRRVLWEEGIEIPDDVAVARAGLQIMALRANEPLEDIRDEFLKIEETLKSRGLEGHPDLGYYMGIYHVRVGDVARAAEHFERALSNLGSYRGGDTIRMMSNLSLPNWVIAYAAIQGGNLQKAVKFSVAALQDDKYCPEAINVLLNAFLAEFKPGMSAESYWQFLCKLYDAGNLKDLLFLRKFASEVGFIELTDLIWQAIPPEAREYLEEQE